MRRIFYKIPILSKIVVQRDELLEENIILSNENSKISEFKDIFLSSWTDSWKDFNVQNYSQISELMRDLKKGLDEESKKVVDTLWEKIVYLIPYNRYKKSFLYKVSDFFTEKELKDQKKKIDLSEYKFPDGVDIEIPIFSTKNGLFFLPEGVSKKIKKGVIIDGGAYIGDSSLMFCEYDPLKIYAFEPVDFLYEKMKETIRLNKIEKFVKPVKLGLSKAKGELEIFGINSGASLYSKHSGKSQKINLTTIDHFAQENNLKISLIKLDVEGSELDAINGALETIKKDRPILLISIYHRPEDFFFVKPLIENLNVGYKFMIRKTSPFRVTSETVLIGYVE